MTSYPPCRYKKAQYRQYTDQSFSQAVVQPDYLGMLGPLIVLEPGDTLRVVLKVRSSSRAPPCSQETAGGKGGI